MLQEKTLFTEIIEEIQTLKQEKPFLFEISTYPGDMHFETTDAFKYINDIYDIIEKYELYQEYDKLSDDYISYILQELNIDISLIEESYSSPTDFCYLYEFNEIEETEETLLLYNVINEIKENLIYCYEEDLMRDNSRLKLNLFPYQDENLDHEGFLLYKDIEVIKNSIYDDTEIDEKEIKTEVLHRLFTSQGYTFNDIKNDEKVKNSNFLKSFIDELDNLPVLYSAYITLPIQLNLKQYLDLKNGKIEITYNSVKFGLFNMTHGAGSMLEIGLEKPFSVRFYEHERFTNIQIEGAKYNAYTVDEVYGLTNEYWYSPKFEINRINWGGLIYANVLFRA